jgi:hypothetical protein
MLFFDVNKAHKISRLLYIPFYIILSITNPTPLKNNLVLEICKRKDIESRLEGGWIGET